MQHEMKKAGPNRARTVHEMCVGARLTDEGDRDIKGRNSIDERHPSVSTWCQYMGCKGVEKGRGDTSMSVI